MRLAIQLLCSVVCFSALTSAANAQVADNEAGIPQGNDTGDIVVTARKGQERLMDVPSAVSAVQQSDLINKGISTLNDLTAVVPGLNMSPNIGGSNVILRGINTGSDAAAASGITVDGIPVGSSSSNAQGGSSGFDLDPFDLERVEVLRGPQGTLYGASTLGGLVSYVSRKPSLETMSGSVQGEASFTQKGEGSHTIRGAVEGPIVPGMLGLRVSGFQENRGGYIDNNLTGAKDINGAERFGGRAALRFEPSSIVRLDLAALYQKSKADALDFIITNIYGKPIGGDLNYNQYYAPNRSQNMQFYEGSLSIDLGQYATINYLGSYQASKAHLNQNTSNDRLAGTFRAIGLLGLGPRLATPLVESRLYDIDLKKQTHELRLDGSAGSFKWIVGGFFTRETAFQTQMETPRNIAGPVTAFDPLLKIDLDSSYKEYAAFGNLTFNPFEALEVTGGIRIGKNEQRYQQFNSGSSLPGLNALLPASSRFPASTPTASSSETIKTFLGSVKYSFNRDTMAYFRFSTGYRPGGPNVTGPGASPTYQHDSVESYEAGFKIQDPDHVISADIVGYYLVWKDIQVLQSVNGFSSRANGNNASVRGVEAVVSVKPIRGLRFDLTAAYTDAHLDEAIPQVAGLNGETLPNSPRWSSNFAGSYEWAIGGQWNAFVDGNLRMVSDRQTNFLSYVQAPGIRLDGYVTGDMRAGAKTDALTISLFMRNVNDARAMLGGRSLFGINEVTVARPRTIGAMAQFNF